MPKKTLILFILVITVIACSSSDEGSTGSDDNFDRSALLTNLADNIILPSLENFQAKMSVLDIARGNFVNEVNQTNLDLLSDAWLEAYKAWQYIEMFNIGKAETFSIDDSRGFVTYFNRYPITKTDIETAASSGNYDLTAIPSYNSQGFPGLDFLIHGIADSDTTPLEKFTTNANADGYVAYTTDVVSHMNSTINTIVNDWQGGFRNEFVNNTSSSATGSFSKIVNDFVNYYERGLRANKIGIPAGNFSNNPLPEKVEAFYIQNVSKELALLGLEAVQNVFNGQSLIGGSTSGESFASYLDYLDRTELKNEINSKFEEAFDKIELLDSNFTEQINTDNTKMTEAYDALQSAVVLLKVDMVSVFNVSVDFQDNDGD